MVRDGISAPARNRKLLEVQGEEERRSRIFRVLSILSPGAGQFYGQKALIGLPLTFLWYVVLSALFLSSRLPISDSPDSLTHSWAVGVAIAVLAVVFVLANRIGPDRSAPGSRTFCGTNRPVPTPGSFVECSALSTSCG